MKELPEKCPNLARYLYPWAGDMRTACRKHMLAMMAISHAIGSELTVRTLNPPEPCSHINDLDQLQPQDNE